MNKKVGSNKWNRGISLFLTILLIALPALAQSTQEQEQPAQVASDAERKEPEKTLIDEEQGRLDGKNVGYESAKVNFDLVITGCLASLGVSTVSALIMKENECYNGPTGAEIGMLAGALFGLVGLIYYTDGPMPSDLIGKSSEYVAAYQKAFRRAFKKEQLKRYYSSYLLAAVLVYLFEKAFQASMEH